MPGRPLLALGGYNEAMVSRIGGSMVEVRQNWKEFIDKGQLAVAEETALAMILGVSALSLNEMAGEHQGLRIVPGPASGKWTFFKEGGADFGSSLRQSYITLYETASLKVGSGQRPDEVGELQFKLAEVWDLLAMGLQNELRQLGQSPDRLGNNLPG